MKARKYENLFLVETIYFLQFVAPKDIFYLFSLKLISLLSVVKNFTNVTEKVRLVYKF